MKRIILIAVGFIISILITNCSENQPNHDIKDTHIHVDTISESHELLIDSTELSLDTIIEEQVPCVWDEYLLEQGLVNIQSIDSSILVDLKYSSEDNFMEKDVYGCLENCYLQPDVAEKLKNAQAYLKKKDSTLTLLLYDGVRPRSVQQYMWDILDMPINEKTKFVSNPKNGSLHNFGAAVDITLANAESGEALDMGTPYDYFGILAWPIKEKLMLEDSLLTVQQVDNRKLLRRAMRHGGFFNIQSEWWHFNSCYRDSAYIKYSIIEGITDSSQFHHKKHQSAL